MNDVGKLSAKHLCRTKSCGWRGHLGDKWEKSSWPRYGWFNYLFFEFLLVQTKVYHIFWAPIDDGGGLFKSCEFNSPTQIKPHSQIFNKSKMSLKLVDLCL